MTKHLRADVASQHLEARRFYVSAGRAASAPALRACSRSDERDDRWGKRDDAELIERRHSKPRFAVFTQMKVAKGPNQRRPSENGASLLASWPTAKDSSPTSGRQPPTRTSSRHSRGQGQPTSPSPLPCRAFLHLLNFREQKYEIT